MDRSAVNTEWLLKAKWVNSLSARLEVARKVIFAWVNLNIMQTRMKKIQCRYDQARKAAMTMGEYIYPSQLQSKASMIKLSENGSKSDFNTPGNFWSNLLQGFDRKEKLLLAENQYIQTET